MSHKKELGIAGRPFLFAAVYLTDFTQVGNTRHGIKVRSAFHLEQLDEVDDVIH